MSYQDQIPEQNRAAFIFKKMCYNSDNSETSNGTQLSLLSSKYHIEKSISFRLLWEPP